MPLSEHEQRLLDQIERALYAEDPKFAATVRTTDLRSHTRRRLRRAGVVLALGLVVTVTGVARQSSVLMVAGFVVLLGGLLLGLTGVRRGGGNDTGSVGQRKGARKAPQRPPMKQRMEDRWRRRWDEPEH